MRFIALCLLAVTAASCSNPSEDGPDEGAMVVVARKAVQARLRDPSSAEFRNEHVGHYKNATVMCGEVNAKNGFGGMTGFERFISNGGEVTVLASDMDHNEFGEVWNMTGC